MTTVLSGLSFPEGPRWFAGELWFSDIHAHRVVAVTPEGRARTVVEIDDRPSGLGFLPDGSLLVVAMIDRQLLRVVDGEAQVYADLAALSGHFVNDMVVDGNGRAYVGSRSGNGNGTDSVLMVDTDRTVHEVATGLSSPNGTVVSPDGRTLTVAETSIGVLTSYSIAPDGTLSAPRRVAELPGAHFDGIALDAEGAVWCGTGLGGAQRLLDGRVTQVVERPGRMVIACALGGADRQTLYLTTTSPRLHANLAYIGWDRTRDACVHSDGAIEAVAVDVPGAGWP